MADLRGHFMCGAVTWTTSRKPLRNLVCHSEDCQRATSSPFTALVGLSPDDVNWKGEINHFESSPGSWRGFCAACGTRLNFQSDSWPGEIHIHAAMLEKALAYHPTAQVVLRSRQSWLDDIDDLPCFKDVEAKPANGHRAEEPQKV